MFTNLAIIQRTIHPHFHGEFPHIIPHVWFHRCRPSGWFFGCLLPGGPRGARLGVRRRLPARPRGGWAATRRVGAESRGEAVRLGRAPVAESWGHWKRMKTSTTNWGCLRGFDVESTASIWCGFYRENYSEPLFIDIMGISGIKGYNFLRLEPGKTHYSCLLFTIKYMNSIHIVYYFHGDLSQQSIWTFSDFYWFFISIAPTPQHICRREAPVSEGRLLLIWMTRESQKERWLVPNWGTQRLLHAQYWCMPSNMVLDYLSTTSAYGTFYAHVLPTPLQAMDDLGWMSIEVAWQHWGNIRYFDIWFGVDLMFCIRKKTLGITWISLETAGFHPNRH